MPRATWKGFITFGLVNIPVSLFTGEKRADLQFNLIDARDQAHIRYQRVNEETGEEVPWNQIVRAYEYSDGSYVVMEEEDFNRASVEATREIAVDAFVERGSIEPYFFEKPYVVVPEKGGEKAYVLLREALETSDRVGIARVVIRGREYLIGLMAEGDALLANRMRFAQELVDPHDLGVPEGTLRQFGITAQELDAAEKLVEAMADEWQPEQYQDEYREVLLDWIDKKARTGEVVPEPEEQPKEKQQKEPEKMMDLLQRSLEEVRNK